MPFELRDHTADVAVAATDGSVDGVFASVADGLAAASCADVPDPGECDSDRFSLTVAAESREALLYDYLADLIYERDVRTVLPVDNEASIEEPRTEGPEADAWHLDASARGVPLEAIDAREVKAVTYSEMALEETLQGWRAYVVFDV
ncbi:protein archease [Halobacteriales archaeon QS_3_64_16]|nr:MAG: protein archease [Halobacteriales archaeon QS_3_64_16]